VPTRNIHRERLVWLRCIVERRRRQQIPATTELDGVPITHFTSAATFGRRTAELNLMAFPRYGRITKIVRLREEYEVIVVEIESQPVVVADEASRARPMAVVIDHIAAVRPCHEQSSIVETKPVRIVIPRLEPRALLARALDRHVSLVIAPCRAMSHAVGVAVAAGSLCEAVPVFGGGAIRLPQLFAGPVDLSESDFTRLLQRIAYAIKGLVPAVAHFGVHSGRVQKCPIAPPINLRLREEFIVPPLPVPWHVPTRRGGAAEWTPILTFVCRLPHRPVRKVVHAQGQGAEMLVQGGHFEN
jgi:hypothetical protein